MNNAKKLSREEIAYIEIGNTQVTSIQKWGLTIFFLLFIGTYPILQMFYRQPFAEWRREKTLQKSIKAYETAIEDNSLLRKWLLPPAQRLLTETLHTGNEKVIIGHDGWLFFSGDYEYLINPGFLRPEKLHKRLLSEVQPDPVKAITDFQRQLAERNIRLILLPVPVKPMIYPDKLGGAATPLQNASWPEFKHQIEAAGVTVIDLVPDFSAMRKLGIAPYLKTDTHWTPEGMLRAAKLTASVAGGTTLRQENSDAVSHSVMSHTATGDTAAMLNLPESKEFFPAETVQLTEYNFVPDRNAEILLLGDSFTNIYSLPAMNWGSKAGFAETLAAQLQQPLDVIARNDAGAYATRQLLANELKRGRDRLAGKKVVIWEFAIRELANGDWKILDMTLENVPESQLLEITEPRTVTATVLAVTPVPRPNSAPYKDHVMSILIGDIDGGNNTALVYVPSMRNNVWTKAASLRPGDVVSLDLFPFEQYEATYGSWNRSEFDDESLLLATPAWGSFNHDK